MLFACGSAEREQARLGREMSWSGGVEVDELEREDAEEAGF